MSTDGQQQIVFEITAHRQSGKLRHRVKAIIGEQTVHLDTFDLTSSRYRTAFVRRVIPHAQILGVPVEEAELEAQLLEHANEVVLDDEAECPTEDTPPADVLAAFGLSVLGENDDQSILIWSCHTKKQFVIKSPSNWKQAEVLQSIGGSVADRLWQGRNDEEPEGTYTLDQLQRALALAAADAPRLSKVEVIGQGVWKREERLLIVDGAEARFYDGSDFTRQRNPRIGTSIIEFDGSKLWHGQIRPMVRRIDAEASRRLLRRCGRLLGQWHWTHAWDDRTAAALVFATFVQAVWSWRPWVAILGPSESGKTTLFQILHSLFFKWGILADRSTEAGLRQAVGHDAAPLLIDEFDRYRHRQQVLELCRTTGRGGRILRGTADQKGQEFRLRHLPWFAAIESGDVWGQDRNRFLQLELQLPDDRVLCLPSEGELIELGHELAAAAIWAAAAATRLSDAIKGMSIDGVQGRLVESFSVPAAMFAVLRHGREVSEVNAQNVLRHMINGRQNLQAPAEPDEHQLLRDILATSLRVAVPHGTGHIIEELSVGQLLHQYREFSAQLDAKGIRVVASRNGRPASMLFIAHDVVQRHLLSDTRWRNSRIDQLLIRIGGASREQQRCAGGRPHGVVIPLEACLPVADRQDTNETA